MPDQKTRCPGGFSVMWVTKLLISPVKKRIFCPKTTKFGPKLAFLVNLGQAMQAYSVPCWWVGWWLWRAGCISQDTYVLYQTSQELRMLSRSLSDCKSLLLNLNLNLNRCLSSDCSDCSAIVVLL